MTRSSGDAAELREAFYAGLAPAIREAVTRVVEAGAVKGGVYAAGGVVRDLMLGRAILDVDLVTEADAIEVARTALPGTPMTVHGRFRTASIAVDGARIDVATAREETYAQPGALPDVRPSSIEQDMARRDFTVNAMALRLDDEASLVDPHGGQADIEARLIRVLHDRSFIDDATRIFRAFRYAARLGFRIEAHTRWLMDAGVAYIETISGERLRRELELMIEEETGGLALEMAGEAGALAAIDPVLVWTSRETAALSRPLPADVERAPFGFALLARHATPYDAQQIAERLRLHREERAAVEAIASMQSIVETLRRPDAKPSGVVTLLDRYPIAAVAAFARTVDDPIAAQLAHRYLDEWRHEKPILSGHDLLAAGVPEGPQVERGLQLIRAARLDGWARDRGDEQALALRFAKSIRDSDAMHQPLKIDPNGN